MGYVKIIHEDRARSITLRKRFALKAMKKSEAGKWSGSVIGPTDAPARSQKKRLWGAAFRRGNSRARLIFSRASLLVLAWRLALVSQPSELPLPEVPQALVLQQAWLWLRGPQQQERVL